MKNVWNQLWNYECRLEYANVRDDLKLHKYLCCNTNYHKKLSRDLKPK